MSVHALLEGVLGATTVILVLLLKGLAISWPVLALQSAKTVS
jgi:hypothetical protein